MKVISRKDAKATGAKRYFTGKACIRGHVAERFTCNKTCVECDALRREARKAKVQPVVQPVVNVEVKTVVKVVSVPKHQVRIVKFKVVGRDRRYMGREKYNCDIIEDCMVSVG